MLAFLPEWLSFMTDWWFMGLMILLLLAFVGLFLFLRNKRPED
jgi:hypothetical protein